MHAGTNTFMTFIYMQADFCQYVKSLFFRSFLESEMYLPVQYVHMGKCVRIKRSGIFSSRSAKFQKLVTNYYRDVQHTTFANIKNGIAVIR